jgi:hypothetical protein
VKIILNKCFGGFDLSKKAYELYANKIGKKIYAYKSEDFRDSIYKKVNDDKLFVTYFTKDFGDIAEINDDDYEKYVLYLRDDYRLDKTLIEVVEELGKEASGMCGNLKVVEIPDNYFYKIDEYDGLETIYYSESEIKIK